MTAAALAEAPSVPTTAEAAARIARDGYCILPGLLPLPVIQRWHDAFMPIHAAVCARPDIPTNRGPARRYMDLPFAPPFSDPLVQEHPAILALVDAMLGPDTVLLHFGTDTPEAGSENQGIHSDLPELFPELGLVLPTYVLTVNIPLVDITAENGPFEGACGTHRLTHADGQARVASGEIPLTPILMKRGDVLVRDPRMLHRGTANPGAARPVVVLALHRPWYRHGYGLEPIAISAPVRDTLSERGRKLMRMHLDHPRCV
jgi:hypothetical protein